jgi:predicted dehydrogenase/threonine dehydrogenase-like Zn-dependent dehydrogenase
LYQLTQKLKSGNLKIIETPTPVSKKGQVIVKNHFSLISAGTETSTVKAARKSLLGKAKERPQQVKQVIDNLKLQGPVQTYRAVMKKLDAYSPLGYSSAGEVISVGDGVRRFSAGDLVACGGLTASHSEIVSVPENLCVPLPSNSDLKQASYNTVGAIAMQGVRQADLRLGETCAVIGLGLLGQITGLLLKASGVKVVGIDIDPWMVSIALDHCVDFASNRNDEGLEERVLNFTDRIGCDAVIISAASISLDPINFAGAIVKKRGTIVILGAVPTGFDREPHFYKKELHLKMSCSYGPGRYDPIYEEKGIDYPVGYVRWTEKRNMQAFQELVHAKKIDVSYLTTHTFKLDDAPKAYEMMLEKSEPFIGILIEYEHEKRPKLIQCRISVSSRVNSKRKSAVSIGFIGAGSYAQSHLLPNIPKDYDVSLKGIATATGISARSTAERFGFEFCTTDVREILESDEINTIFIATRHNNHAELVLKSLKAGKHVFVEKPLCLTIEELNEIAKLYLSLGDSRPNLMVGFNRRFSPASKWIKDKLGQGPMALFYRINAGYVPSDSWMQDYEIGGGRIIGEVCHFVDFLTYMNGSHPIAVNAMGMKTADTLDDVLNISVSYLNGSIGSIAYYSNGDKGLPKEYCEIYANGTTAVIDDYKKAVFYANGKKRIKRSLIQNKGQHIEVAEFISAIITGKGNVIPVEEIFSTSMVTFNIIESIHYGKCVRL